MIVVRRGLAGILLLLPFLLVFRPGAAFAEEFVAPLPGWVVEAEIPVAAPDAQDNASGGVSFLLLDRQVDWQAGEGRYYSRFVYRVQGSQGLEDAAAIGADYDPTHELLRFNKIVVIRGGQATDITHTAGFEVFRQEQSLDQGIVDGRLTVHANLKDIRVGDIIDYAYSVVRKPKIAAGDFFVQIPTKWSIPVVQARARITIHGDKPLRQRSVGGARLEVVDSSPGRTVYEWNGRDLAPVPEEDNAPAWFDSHAAIDVSTMEDWFAIVTEMASYYTPSAALPPAFAAELDGIAAAAATPAEKISRALWLVQDQIRYVGLEIGRGSYVPRRPEEVIASSYGDCKDKALLLVSALNHLGIEAEAALVDLDEGEGLADRLPSPFAFDHAIVRATVGADSYWLDPTQAHQGGIGRSMAQPDYGYALPLKPGVGLISMRQPPPGQPTATAAEVFEVPQNPEMPIRLRVTTQYRGHEADQMRAHFASTSRAATAKRYNDYYSRLYPGAVLEGDIGIADDREANTIDVSEYYLIDQEELIAGAADGMWPLRASMIEDALPTPSAVRRRAPVALDRMVYRRHTVEIQGTRVKLKALDAVEIDGGPFRFLVSSTSKNGLFRAEWVLQVKQPFVPADGIKAYLRDANRAISAMSWQYRLASLTDAADDGQSRAVTPSLGVMVAGFFLVVFVGGAVFLVVATRHGLRADKDYAGSGYYYPVALPKFLLMSIGTVGFYTCFWLWKCNRWRNTYDGGQTRPFWRAVFYPFWLYPAFAEANRRNQIDPLPDWLGVVAALLCAALVPLGILGNIALRDGEEGLDVIFPALQSLCFIPAVLAVNRLHGRNHVALVRNSGINGWNVIGLLLGACLIVAPFVLPKG